MIFGHINTTYTDIFQSHTINISYANTTPKHFWSTCVIFIYGSSVIKFYAVVIVDWCSPRLSSGSSVIYMCNQLIQKMYRFIDILLVRF